MVLLKSGGVKQTQLICDFLTELRGLSNLNGRVSRVSVNRGSIQPEIGCDLLQVKAADAIHIFIRHDGRR